MTRSSFDAAAATKRRVDRHGGIARQAILAPASGVPLALLLERDAPRFDWLNHPLAWPWKLWAFAGCGTLGRVGGSLDWRHLRSGLAAVGPPAHPARVAGVAGVADGAAGVRTAFQGVRVSGCAWLDAAPTAARGFSEPHLNMLQDPAC